MTLARPVLPGRTYLITRRCTQRQFLLRPDDKTNQAFLYCLGEAAARFQIELIAWTAMSNHYHAIVYDPTGRLPDFLCHFHQMAAKVLNVRWSRWENFWASEQPCTTFLVDDDDIFDKALYTLVNPVVDALVDRVADWPGASSWSCHSSSRPLRIKRPAIFFSGEGCMPRETTLVASAPRRAGSSSERWDLEDWNARLRAAVERVERDARAERQVAGRRVLGRRAVRKLSAFSAPGSHEPRRNLRPALACKSIARRVTELAALTSFHAAYLHARALFSTGDRAVLFPLGTFALRRLGALCHLGPAPS